MTQPNSSKTHPQAEESKKSIVKTEPTKIIEQVDHPRWLQNELNCLNSLTAKFSFRCKKTFKKIETCRSESDANQMANEMYLDLM